MDRGVADGAGLVRALTIVSLVAGIDRIGIMHLVFGLSKPPRPRHRQVALIGNSLLIAFWSIIVRLDLVRIVIIV